MPHRAAFLDLNGTLVLPVQVERLADYTLIPGAIEAVRLLNEHGYLCPVITVQSRIGKGYFTAEAFQEWFTELQRTFVAQGAELLGPYVCPHGSRDNCACNKPASTLYRQAAQEHDIDLAASFVLGDTGSDCEAAKRLGCPAYLVRTGWGESSLRDYGVTIAEEWIAADVLDAARRIITVG